MADHDSLDALQGLHRDLCAYIDLQLPVLERLIINLESQLDNLRALLDKKPKSEASRKTLHSGTITVGDDEFSVNQDFQQQALELSEALDLDELDAAALFLGAQSEAEELDRSQLQTAVIRFHRRREYVLLCLRILCKAALETPDTPIEHSEALRVAVQYIVGVNGTTSLAGAYGFWAKCLAAMQSIEKWLRLIAERIQSTQVVGQVPLPGFVEIMDFQRQSLTRQHENLAAICTHMVKAGYVNLDNYNALLTRAKSLDRHDLITIHYIPVILRLTFWAASEANVPSADARRLHDSIMAGRDSDNWHLRSLHAATITWWLAEYSGRYVDPNTQDPGMQGIDFDAEAAARSDAFLKALNDGAFHFMLSCSQDVRPINGYDPQKTSMLSTLLQDTAVLSPDSPQPEDFFRALIMDQLQTFVDAYITNMPDTLRRLKVEEDDQRRRLQLHFQRSTGEYPLHLERFMIIVAYAFDGCPDAASDFWSDKESNLYGFLQWAAKRQPTPRIAMFCEMLRAISIGDGNADSAHKFLLEEGASASGKIRRTSSLSYTHVFNELVEFQKDIHTPRKTIQGGGYNAAQNPVDQIVEPESATMLESYLRLLAHICRQSITARTWILDLKDYDFADICFGLCTDKVESGLRAAAYDALSALLEGKIIPRAHAMWNLLDDWTASGYFTGSKPSTGLGYIARDDFWATLADGYDESTAFVRLLTTLVEPYPDNDGLDDSLPFPEGLGSSRRMPGINAYVDFVMASVLAERSLEVIDPLQRNVMKWTCLRFVVTCLSTFNENLLIIANKTNLDVDQIIDATSLATYVALHPFTRVMEWLFNDKVIKALFAASHQDVAEVDAARSDSPLVQSLMLSIEVMDLVMKLQATYLDIVRPLLRQQPSSQQQSPVSNLSLASFEDAILNNLQIIVDLGLYCGTGHEALTIASLQLLEKMAASRKLAISPAGFGQRSGRSKIVGILEKDNEAERIGRSLAGLMRFSTEELEAGPDASGYVVKTRILEFLNSCLAAVSLRPTIAHILLGFTCESTTVKIVDDSLWSNGQSLFHSILLLGVEYEDHDGEQFLAWRSTLKTSCWTIMQRLWRSPLTSAIVMEELRNNEFLYVEAPRLVTITLDVPWDGMSLAHGMDITPGKPSEFFSGPSALALQSFLQRRAAFLDYQSRELRLTIKEDMPITRSRIQSVLLGSTILAGQDAVSNPNIFDLFDFVEFAYPERDIPDQHELFIGVSPSACQEEKDNVSLYSLPLLEQVLRLKMKEWSKNGRLVDPNIELGQAQRIEVALDANSIMAMFTDLNRRAQLQYYHYEILQSWVQLVMVAVHSCDFDNGAQSSFIMQTVQAILPKLEQSYNSDLSTALQLAGLAESLVQKIDFNTIAFDKTGDFANDRMCQLFRAALGGIYCSITTPQLREYCYQIAFRYIHGTSMNKSSGSSPLGRHTLDAVKNCGSHLMEIICDDAYSGQGTCKISALLLLNAMVTIATRQQSKYVLETFVSLNFVGVLVDNLKHIPDELRGCAGSQIPLLLSYYDTSLALLLRMCQSRLGAAYVLNAGLFQSIRDSHIFAVDPDIGLEFDDPKALKKYYSLMLNVLRVINAAIIARGRQNDQSVFQAREFLREYRHSMVAIFKRTVNTGVSQDEETSQTLADLVDCWTVLVDVTGFLQYEDRGSVKQSQPNVFS